MWKLEKKNEQIYGLKKTDEYEVVRLNERILRA